jgi:hypothetical protein
LDEGGAIYWGRLQNYGRNGLGLLVLALAWWGQSIWNAGVADGMDGGDAALAACADWNFMVIEMAWVMGFLGDHADRPGLEEEMADRAADAALGEKETGKKKGKGQGKKVGSKQPKKR